MDTKQALKWVKDNWVKLPHGTAYEYGSSNPTPDCVWFAESDTSQGYDVDIEKVGMTKDGRLIWAYASGCSCWEGEYYSEEIGCTTRSVKNFEFQHQDMKDEWSKQLLKFVSLNQPK